MTETLTLQVRLAFKRLEHLMAHGGVLVIGGGDKAATAALAADILSLPGITALHLPLDHWRTKSTDPTMMLIEAAKEAGQRPAEGRTRLRADDPAHWYDWAQLQRDLIQLQRGDFVAVGKQRRRHDPYAAATILQARPCTVLVVEGDHAAHAPAQLTAGLKFQLTPTGGPAQPGFVALDPDATSLLTAMIDSQRQMAGLCQQQGQQQRPLPPAAQPVMPVRTPLPA